MDWYSIALLSSVTIVLAVIAVLLGCYNGLDDRRTAALTVLRGFAAELKCRADLLTRIVDVILEHLQRNDVAITHVAELPLTTDLRRRLLATPPTAVTELQSIVREMETASRRITAVAEANPTIGASARYVALREQLDTTETRINETRHHYNERVAAYYATMARLPWSVIAHHCRFEPLTPLADEPVVAQATPVPDTPNAA